MRPVFRSHDGFALLIDSVLLIDSGRPPHILPDYSCNLIFGYRDHRVTEPHQRITVSNRLEIPMRAQNQSHPLAAPATGDIEVTEVRGSKFSRDLRDNRLAHAPRVTPLNLMTSTLPHDDEEGAAETAKEPRSFTGFLLDMMDQLVADFAVAAAATHPETYILLSEINRQEEQARTQPDHRRRNPWPDPQSYPRRLPDKAPDGGDDRVQPLITPHPMAYLTSEGNNGHDLARETGDEMVFPNLVGWLGDAMGALTARVKKAREVRRSIAELQSLDDRMLRDIGVTRYEIQLAARRGRMRD